MTLEEALLYAHKRAASVVGRLSLTLERRKIGKRDIAFMVEQLRDAADVLEQANK